MSEMEMALLVLLFIVFSIVIGVRNLYRLVERKWG